MKNALFLLLAMGMTHPSTSQRIMMAEAAKPQQQQTVSVTAKEPDGIQYQIAYSEKSNLKDVPLMNARLQIQAYYNGNPQGRETINTNDKQAFYLTRFKDPKVLAIEIVSIDKQNDFKARCTGFAKPGETTINIECKKV